MAVFDIGKYEPYFCKVLHTVSKTPTSESKFCRLVNFNNSLQNQKLTAGSMKLIYQYS